MTFFCVICKFGGYLGLFDHFYIIFSNIGVVMVMLLSTMSMFMPLFLALLGFWLWFSNYGKSIFFKFSDLISSEISCFWLLLIIVRWRLSLLTLLTFFWFILWLVFSLSVYIVISISVLTISVSIFVIISGSVFTSGSFFLLGSLNLFLLNWFLFFALSDWNLFGCCLNWFCLYNNSLFNWASLLLDFCCDNYRFFFFNRLICNQWFNKMNLLIIDSFFRFFLNFFIAILCNKSSKSFF